jgi:hypothetical protein
VWLYDVRLAHEGDGHFEPQFAFACPPATRTVSQSSWPHGNELAKGSERQGRGRCGPGVALF